MLWPRVDAGECLIGMQDSMRDILESKTPSLAPLGEESGQKTRMWAKGTRRGCRQWSVQHPGFLLRSGTLLIWLDISARHKTGMHLVFTSHKGSMLDN